MPSNTGAPAAAPAGQPRDRQAAGSTDWKWAIGRALLMYVGINAVINPSGPVGSYVGKLFGKATSTEGAIQPPSDTLSGASVNASQAADVSPAAVRDADSGANIDALPPSIAIPAWPQDSKLDFYVYISSGPAPDQDALKTQSSNLVPGGGLKFAPALPYDAFQDIYAFLQDPLHLDYMAQIEYPTRKTQGPLQPLAAVKWSGVPLGDGSMTRNADLTLKLDDTVRKHNGSIWADFVIAQQGVSPDPSNPNYQHMAVYRSRKLLSRLIPLKKKREEKNLFDKDAGKKPAAAETKDQKQKEAEAALETATPAKIVGHWHGNLSLALVQDDDKAGVQIDQLPPPILQYVSIIRQPGSDEMVHEPAPASSHMNAAGSQPDFVLRYPTLFPNDFWLLKEHMHPINETVVEVPLHINLYHQSWFKFQILAAMSDSFDRQQSGVTGGEIDMIKTMLLETNPFFLALTIIVSVLHSLFEFLAFSSDVRHWKNKDDLAGVSVGSILTNVVVQLIITLYLLDNNEDTSWMILAGQAVGVLIECWKLTKAVTVGLKRAPPGSWMPYRIQIEDKHRLSEEEKKTQEYDKLAFRYVGIAVGPILVCYTLYSALYQTHRGWWSFIISTATSFVYAFGFVSLVPQLIVNYKLKSTAGMNHKTFMYKILGTFVDDLFAFCIKMPTLHRLACFRDDIVFFIFLYQRWIYGVDPTRRNEFGQQLEDKPGSAVDASKGGEKGADIPSTSPRQDRASASGIQPASTQAKARRPAK